MIKIFRNHLFATSVLGLVFLTACGNSFLDPKRFVPEKADQFARSYFESFVHKDLAKLEEPLEPQLKTPAMRKTLEQMMHFMDLGQPEKTEMAGWNVMHFKNQTRYDLTYQIKFGKTWRLANIVMTEADGNFTVNGIHVYPLEKSLQELNRFTLDNKPIGSLAFLAIVVLIPLFMLMSLVFCLFSRIPMKWLVAFACLIGIGNLSMNWTNGQIQFNLLSIQLLGIGAGKISPFSPWILVASMPLGAIGFWAVKLFYRGSGGTASRDVPPPLPV